MFFLQLHQTREVYISVKGSYYMQYMQKITILCDLVLFSPCSVDCSLPKCKRQDLALIVNKALFAGRVDHCTMLVSKVSECEPQS